MKIIFGQLPKYSISNCSIIGYQFVMLIFFVHLQCLWQNYFMNNAFVCLLVDEHIFFPKLITTRWCFFNPHQSRFLIFSTIIFFSLKIFFFSKLLMFFTNKLQHKLLITYYPLLVPLMLFTNELHHKLVNLLPIFGFINVL